MAIDDIGGPRYGAPKLATDSYGGSGMRISLVALSLALAITAGCNKNKKATAKPVANNEPVAETAVPGEEVRTGLPDTTERVSLSTIFFELDSHVLTAEAKATLDKN